MAHTPKINTHIVEISDAEEAVFEALLPTYLEGNLSIEKVRQISPTIAAMLESFVEARNEAKTGNVYSEAEFYSMLADDE